MKLEREVIVKALKWCTELRLCVDCPLRAEYFSHSGNACRRTLMENALSLIEELTEENERLRGEKESGNKELFHKWKKLADETADRFEGLYEDAKKALVTDTVMKMHSEIEARCIKGGIYPAFVKSTIDQIAEEIIKA